MFQTCSAGTQFALEDSVTRKHRWFPPIQICLRIEMDKWSNEAMNYSTAFTLRLSICSDNESAPRSCTGVQLALTRSASTNRVSISSIWPWNNWNFCPQQKARNTVLNNKLRQWTKNNNSVLFIYKKNNRCLLSFRTCSSHSNLKALLQKNTPTPLIQPMSTFQNLIKVKEWIISIDNLCFSLISSYPFILSFFFTPAHKL